MTIIVILIISIIGIIMIMIMIKCNDKSGGISKTLRIKAFYTVLMINASEMLRRCQYGEMRNSVSVEVRPVQECLQLSSEDSQAGWKCGNGKRRTGK